jgi:hypothetical protein
MGKKLSVKEIKLRYEAAILAECLPRAEEIKGIDLVLEDRTVTIHPPWGVVRLLIEKEAARLYRVATCGEGIEDPEDALDLADAVKAEREAEERGEKPIPLPPKEG